MKSKLIKHFITKRSGAWICQCGYGEFNLNSKRMLRHIFANHPAQARELAQGKDGEE